ncbi:MAG: hypothetical protein Q8M92_05105 [Candidatus Subteraquimicrobiales bacterium]|nr:hypothetical protein [Candidatus Subteraquimicrobiales bacterium]
MLMEYAIPPLSPDKIAKADIEVMRRQLDAIKLIMPGNGDGK